MRSMKSKPAGEIETQRHDQDAGHGDKERLDVAGQNPEQVESTPWIRPTGRKTLPAMIAV